MTTMPAPQRPQPAGQRSSASASNQPQGLAAEIGKATPFALPEREAILNALRTAAILEADYNRFLRTFGLSIASYNVLRILRHHGEKGRTTSAVRNDMVRPVPDLTRLIDRLERDGLVERTRCTEDRRVVYVALTDRGRQVVNELDGPLDDQERAMAGHLSEDELAQLSALLVKLRARPASACDLPPPGA